MAEHKLASAVDFRNRIKDEDCYEPAREVMLPKSEMWVLLRKPKPLAYTLLGAPLPGIPQERTEGAEAGTEAAKPSASDAEAGFRAGRSARAGGAAHGVKSPFLRSVKPLLDSVFAALAAPFLGVSEVKGVAWRASRGILARKFRQF